MNKVKTKKELYRLMTTGWQLGTYSNFSSPKAVLQIGGLGMGGGTREVEPSLVNACVNDQPEYLRAVNLNAITTTYVIDTRKPVEKEKK